MLLTHSFTMKLSTFLVFSTASLVLAAPAATIEKRADFCGQYDTATKGSYIVYNNLWGEGAATSGSQCSGIDGLSNNIISWHTSWTWAGGYILPSSLPPSLSLYLSPVHQLTIKQIARTTLNPTPTPYPSSPKSPYHQRNPLLRHGHTPTLAALSLPT